jgi:hypothetical protein
MGTMEPVCGVVVEGGLCHGLRNCAQSREPPIYLEACGKHEDACRTPVLVCADPQLWELIRLIIWYLCQNSGVGGLWGIGQGINGQANIMHDNDMQEFC